MANVNPINNDSKNESSTNEDAVSAAFDAVAAEIAAVPETELLPITIDVLGAASTVRGVLPELRAMRPEFESNLRHFDFERFDRLEQYARALTHTQGVYRSATAPKSDVTALANELIAVRDRLYLSAMSLVGYQLMDGERLKSCKTQLGYRAVAADVFTLATVFRDHWEQVQGQTPVTLASLVKARNLADELLEAMGLKDQAPVTSGEAALTRQKAFTLFVRTYEKARRAVHYLRAADGDADDIAPSLYGSRGNARRSTKEEPVASAPVTSAPANEVEGTTPLPPPLKLDNPMGLPLTSPFSS